MMTCEHRVGKAKAQ